MVECCSGSKPTDSGEDDERYSAWHIFHAAYGQPLSDRKCTAGQGVAACSSRQPHHWFVVIIVLSQFHSFPLFLYLHLKPQNLECIFYNSVVYV